MAGLLGGVLPYLYSRGDAAKRMFNGLLSDPIGAAQQAGGLLADQDRQQEGLLSQTFQNPQRPFQVTDRNALASLVDRTMAGQLGFAPVGMTKMASKIDDLTGLPLNPDGTVTVYHHTSKANADQIQKQRVLKSAGEPAVYVTTEKNPVTGYGDTAVPVNVNPRLLQLDDEFPDGRMDFSIDVKRPGGFFRF